MESPQPHPDRNGPSWEEFLAKHRLRNITDTGRGWRVESASGSTYTVTRVAGIDRGSGGLYFRYGCDCPARGRCRHVDAVEQMLYAEAAADAAAGDTEGLDLMERTE